MLALLLLHSFNRFPGLYVLAYAADLLFTLLILFFMEKVATPLFASIENTIELFCARKTVPFHYTLYQSIAPHEFMSLHELSLAGNSVIIRAKKERFRQWNYVASMFW
jgi:DNA phosphorothioation-dependent restriction protein DptG